MKENLLKVLLRNTSGDYIQGRGAPMWNPFIWPDSEVNWLERELEYIIKNGQNGQFGYGDRYFRYKIRELLWNLYKDGVPTELKISQSLDAFLDSLKIDLNTFTVIWSIHYLNPPMKSISVDKVKIGTLDQLCDANTRKEIYRLIQKWPNLEIETWAKVMIEAPDIKFAAEGAKDEIEEELSLLSSANPRHRANLGDFNELRVSEHYFVINNSSGKIELEGATRSHGSPVSIPLEIWSNEEHYRWKAPPRPWEKFPEDYQIKKHLRDAYRRFGQAVRNSNNPDVCLSFALSSIEALFNTRIEGKMRNSFTVVCYIYLGSIETKIAIPHPLDLIELYQIRNKILHDGISLRQKSFQANDVLWDIYTCLDMLAYTAISNKTKTLTDLSQALKTDENVREFEITINREVGQLNKTKKITSAPVTHKMLNHSIKPWKKIGEILDINIDQID